MNSEVKAAYDEMREVYRETRPRKGDSGQKAINDSLLMLRAMHRASNAEIRDLQRRVSELETRPWWKCW